MPALDIGIDLGIDLGTSFIKIFTPGRGVILNEPAVVAVDRDTDDIVAIGWEAYKMLGRTSDRIAVVYPLRDGVIANYELAENLLTALVRLVCGNRVFMPRVVVCVPVGITEVERIAVVDALRVAGARKVCLINEVIASALGAGIDIFKPYGSVVCDIGGGTTDTGVISLGGMSVSNSVKVAGNRFDDAIIKHVRRYHNLLIGPRTAEDLKKEIGCVFPRDRMLTSIAKGRDAHSGLPAQAEITSDEICEALEDDCIYICRSIQNVLEQAPPELVSDIFESGMTITGGSSVMFGMDKLIARKTKLSIYVAHDAQNCVVMGTGKALDFIDFTSDIDMATSPLEVYSY